MGDKKRSTGLVFGAILAGNAGVLAACGGGGGTVPPAPTQPPSTSPSPAPSSTASGSQSSETVQVGAKPVSTTLPAVAGVAPQITIPGISNAPTGAKATITFSEVAQAYASTARRIIRRDGSPTNNPAWTVDMVFDFQPDLTSSVTAAFNIGEGAGWGLPYWYLDVWSNGQPNCSGIVGPGQLNGENLTFGTQSTITIAPFLSSTPNVWEIKFDIIGSTAALSTDPWCVTASPQPTATVSPTTSPTIRPTATTSPTIMPSSIPATATPTVRPTSTPTPTPTPTPTGGPQVYSAMSIQPSYATIPAGTSQGFVIYQELNGNTYDGPFTVSANSCAGYMSIAVNANHFTVAAGPVSTLCELEVTGGGSLTDYVRIDIP